jgi:hypothetical protein
MSIDVPVLEVLDLADRLRGAAAHGTAAAERLLPVCRGGELAAALDRLCEGARLAAGAIAVETGLLGDTAEETARSWLALDAGLLPRRGVVLAR